MEKTRTTQGQFNPVLNQVQDERCIDVLPQASCPYPHGQMFQGCIAYINSYIDIRARQLYNKLKTFTYGIAGQYNGPWDKILLKDVSHPETIYKVYIDKANLQSNENAQIEEDEETRIHNVMERIGLVSANVSTMSRDVDVAISSVSNIEASVSSIEASVSTLESQMTTLGDLISGVDSRLSSIRGDVISLNQKMDAASRSITSLDNRVREIESEDASEIEQLATNLNSVSAQVSTMSNELGNLTSIVTSATSAISEIQERLSSEATAFPSVDDETIASFNAKYASLSSKVGILHAYINNMGEQLSNIEQLLQISGWETYQTIYDSIVSLKSRTYGLEWMCGVCVNENTAPNWDQIQLTSSGFVPQIEDIQARLSALEQQASNNSSGEPFPNAKISEIEGRLDVVESNASTFNQTLSEFQSIASTIASQISAIQQSIAAIGNQGSQQTGGIAQSQHDALSARVGSVETALRTFGNLAQYNMAIVTSSQYDEMRMNEQLDSHTIYFISEEA